MPIAAEYAYAVQTIIKNSVEDEENFGPVDWYTDRPRYTFEPSGLRFEGHFQQVLDDNYEPFVFGGSTYNAGYGLRRMDLPLFTQLMFSSIDEMVREGYVWDIVDDCWLKVEDAIEATYDHYGVSDPHVED